MTSSADEHRDSIVVAAIGTIVVCAYAVLALIQILWLNPQAAVPGVQLEQIQRDVVAANDSMSAPFTVAVMSIGPVVAVVMLAIAAGRATTAPLAMVLFYLSLLVFGPIAYFMASFPSGMALADTYGISGNDHSPWAKPLYGVSALAFLTLIGVAIASRRPHREQQAIPV